MSPSTSSTGEVPARSSGDPPLHLLEVAGNPTGQDREGALCGNRPPRWATSDPVEHRGGLLGGAIGDQRLSQGEVAEGSAQPAPGERSFGERSPSTGSRRSIATRAATTSHWSSAVRSGPPSERAGCSARVRIARSRSPWRRWTSASAAAAEGRSIGQACTAPRASSALSAASLTRPAASKAPARLADTVATVDSCPIWWAAPMTRSRAPIASLVAPMVLRQNAAAVIAVKSLVGST